MRSRGVLGATAGTVSHPSISASWLEGQFEFDPGLQTESGSELSERQFTIFFSKSLDPKSLKIGSHFFVRFLDHR